MKMAHEAQILGAISIFVGLILMAVGGILK
jgi:hypothetical protein